MTRIKQVGRRYVKEGGGDKPTKCSTRGNETFWQEVRSGRGDINFTVCSFLHAPSWLWPVWSAGPKLAVRCTVGPGCRATSVSTPLWIPTGETGNWNLSVTGHTVNGKKFWRRCTILRTNCLLDFVHRPDEILKYNIKNHDVSEPGSSSIFRWWDGRKTSFRNVVIFLCNILILYPGDGQSPEDNWFSRT